MRSFRSVHNLLSTLIQDRMVESLHPNSNYFVNCSHRYALLCMTLDHPRRAIPSVNPSRRKSTPTISMYPVRCTRTFAPKTSPANLCPQTFAPIPACPDSTCLDCQAIEPLGSMYCEPSTVNPVLQLRSSCSFDSNASQSTYPSILNRRRRSEPTIETDRHSTHNSKLGTVNGASDGRTQFPNLAFSANLAFPDRKSGNGDQSPLLGQPEATSTDIASDGLMSSENRFRAFRQIHVP